LHECQGGKINLEAGIGTRQKTRKGAGKSNEETIGMGMTDPSKGQGSRMGKKGRRRKALGIRSKEGAGCCDRKEELRRPDRGNTGSTGTGD